MDKTEQTKEDVKNCECKKKKLRTGLQRHYIYICYYDIKSQELRRPSKMSAKEFRSKSEFQLIVY